MCCFLTQVKFLSSDANLFFVAYSVPIWSVNLIGIFYFPSVCSCKMHCITQWWFQLMKSNAIFPLCALMVFYWRVLPMKQNCVWFGEKRRWQGKNNGCRGKLVNTVLGEGGKKNPYNSQHNVYLFVLLLASNPFLCLPIYCPVFCVLFNIAKSMESQQKWT